MSLSWLGLGGAGGEATEVEGTAPAAENGGGEKKAPRRATLELPKVGEWLGDG